jgi:protein-S-isoprenylcysteine O-methyltransferase Ste14
MFILVRAVVYASLFIAVLLILVPTRIVARYGITTPTRPGTEQVLGLVFVIVGGTLAVSCILTFVFIGRGTPAPFDPPRRLVVRGPYRWVRNPMYVGATVALCGAGLYYNSLVLLAYGVGFLLATHLFVVLYEEPALRRMFGSDYEEYCRRVGRWWPSPRQRPRLPR